MALKSSSRRLLLVPVIIGVVFGVFNLLAQWEISPGLTIFPGWKSADNSIYDLFLHMKPPIKEDPRLVLLNIDDEAIARAGTYPWPRGLIAQGMEALTEFNAAYAVFDIEYLNKSPRSVDQEYLDVTLKTRFSSNFRDIKSSLYDLINAVSQRAISMADLPSYTDQLAEQVSQTESTLYQSAREVAVENDSYMGKAMRLFGRTFVTLNMQSRVEKTNPEDLRALAKERFYYPKVEHPEYLWSQNKDFYVPIMEVASMAAGAGSTNVDRDKDGKLRRIRLLNNVDGKVYAQLSFRPFLDSLGNPVIVAEPGAIILKQVKIGGTVKDVRIPMDDKGEMLINWPAAQFKKTFIPPGRTSWAKFWKYLENSRDGGQSTGFVEFLAQNESNQSSFWELLAYKQNETELAYLMSDLAGKAAWDLIPGKNPISQVTAIWDDCETLRKTALESGTPEDRKAFVDAKDYYYEVLAQLADSGLDKELVSYIQTAKDKDSKSKASLYDEQEASISQAFRVVNNTIRTQLEDRKSLKTLLEGTTCIIGWTATASTDFGVTPFDELYANVGTHTSVINTILQESFLWAAPWWVSSLLALVLSVGLVFLIQRLDKTGAKILVGGGATVALFFVLFLIFVVSGTYILALAPLLSVFLSFLIFTLAVFFLTEQERSFIRKAFSTYLSNDVIEQMVKDPAMLKLGGQKKWISAMFTDVRGFSTISEKMDPENLVHLLNLYLSGMSDIILENRGTIDKFEGDAIIAFFGAPVDYKEHAACICRSAILMRRKEKELNKHFMEANLSPTPLLTRIGINTGEMVVGNMGTERKMDYTIMGNAVNLAARLEGVNKQYGSWILSTETTKNESGEDFAWRRLDRVRVVGINQPLRLYELVDFKADLGEDGLRLLAEFDAALDIFETRDWKAAQKAFAALAKEFPEDGPCKTYLKRSTDFIDNPPGPEWEGVFNLTEK